MRYTFFHAARPNCVSNQARKVRLENPNDGPLSSGGERKVSMRAKVAHGPSKPAGERSNIFSERTARHFNAKAAASPDMPAPITATSSTGPYVGCVRGSSQSLAGGITSSSKSRWRRASSAASVAGPESVSVTRKLSCGLSAQIGVADARIVQQIARRTGQCNAAGLENIAVIGDPQCQICILLDHEHGHAGPVHGLDQLKHVIDEQRRETHGGFVHAEHARAAHQSARHRDHLLLAA